MSKATWGVSSTQHELVGTDNVDYLAQMTEMFQEQKNRLLDSLQLEPGQHVLDVGCGIGDDARSMAERVGPTGKVVGLDHADAMINESRVRSEGSHLPVEFIQSTVYDMPFDDSVFDATRADRVFQHLDRAQEALAEMIRVTKPGGRISLNDPDTDSMVVDIPDRDLYRRIRSWSSDNWLANGFSGRSFFRFCKAAGLDVLDIELTPIYVTSLDVGDAMVNVSSWAQPPFEAGAITQDEADAWVQMLNDLDEAGQFFMFGTGISVVARKPA